MTTTLQIGVTGALEGLASGPDATALVHRVEKESSELAADIGLVGAVSATVARSDSSRPLRVVANDRSVPYPSDLLAELWTTRPDGTDPPGERSGDSIAADCLSAYVPSLEEASPDEVAELVMQVTRNSPSALVDDDQADAYAAAAKRNGVSTRDLRHVLTSLLDLGIAPVERDLVLDALAEAGDSPGDAVEIAFAVLQRPRVEIAVSRRYRRVLTRSDSGEPELVAQSQIEPSARELFRLLEERLLVEWGIVPPDLVWVTDPSVPDGAIAVRINDRLSSPFPGLREDERVLHLGTASDRQSRRIPRLRTFMNPMNAWLELTVVDAEDAERLKGPMATATPPAGFAAHVVYREIVANADRLLGTEQTLHLLQDLHAREAELVDLVLRHVTIAEITGVLRALLRERIPLRLLPIVLERLARPSVRAMSRTERVEFVRRGLGPYLLHRFGLGDQRRTFYGLSPELEAEVESGARNDLYREQLRDAVWSALCRTNTPPMKAAVIVDSAPREVVYGVLAPELGDVVVTRRAIFESAPEAFQMEAQISLDPAAALTRSGDPDDPNMPIPLKGLWGLLSPRPRRAAPEPRSGSR